MPSNLELKAHLRVEESSVPGIIEKIPELVCLSGPTELTQHDTFYNAEKCRLKLRRENGVATLIAYDRTDQCDSKISDFEKVPVEDPEKLSQVLTKALRVKGDVKKKRVLYIVEFKDLRTRIHIDAVEGLGNFIEFEVMLESETETPIGNEVIKVLKEHFLIADEDLISGSYMDKIISKAYEEKKKHLLDELHVLPYEQFLCLI